MGGQKRNREYWKKRVSTNKPLDVEIFKYIGKFYSSGAFVPFGELRQRLAFLKIEKRTLNDIIFKLSRQGSVIVVPFHGIRVLRQEGTP